MSVMKNVAIDKSEYSLLIACLLSRSRELTEKMNMTNDNERIKFYKSEIEKMSDLRKNLAVQIYGITNVKV